ncbi:MAG: DnaJ domain-containing protein [Pseudomonadota bacterium]
MFEPAKAKVNAVPRRVEIQMRDGRAFRGVLQLKKTASVATLLAGSSPFLSVKTSKGEVAINRDTIAAILLDDEQGIPVIDAEIVSEDKANASDGPVHEEDSDGLDPCGILRVRPGASVDEIRAAWRLRIRQCHPDILQARGHPESVIQAAKIEAQRINAAYAALMEMRDRGAAA